jgi:hypothetical protein
MNGTELANVVKLRSAPTLVLMYTGVALADQCCVDVVLEKPTHLLALKHAVDKSLAAKSP